MKFKERKREEIYDPYLNIPTFEIIEFTILDKIKFLLDIKVIKEYLEEVEIDGMEDVYTGLCDCSIKTQDGLWYYVGEADKRYFLELNNYDIDNRVIPKHFIIEYKFDPIYKRKNKTRTYKVTIEVESL